MANLNLPQIPNSDGKTERNTGNTGSKVDRLTGQHTTSLIIGTLFIIVFISYVVIICIKTSVDPVINTGMFSLLSALIGFFTGSKIKEGKS